MSQGQLLAVLNPAGRDPEQQFPDREGNPQDPGHAPVNYHAYAACTGGGFYRDVRAIPDGTQAVLILLRQRNLQRALEAVKSIKERGMKVLISFKESGSHQVAKTLDSYTRTTLFQAICAAADGYLSSTPDLEALYRACGCVKGIFVPTPYPVGIPAWDFSQLVEKRRGIIVGTREFDTPSRHHVEAVMAADALSRELECPLAVMNTEGRRGLLMLKAIRRKNPLFFFIEGPLPYPKYLKLMAMHRIVFQLDSSAVPGQVAGDSLLCGLPCIGGDGAIERLAFPGLCGKGTSVPALMDSARKLLGDEGAYVAEIEHSQRLAGESISFGVVSARLAGFISSLHEP